MKKRQKKKSTSGGGRRRIECSSPSLSHMNVPQGTPSCFFSHQLFVHLPSTNIDKKNSRAVCCVVQFFININNETLVWSEKDGGSAFAGGNDGQGDKLLTRSFLSFLSLRGGVSRVSILSSRISISLLIFPIDKKIVLSLLYLLNSWTRAQHRSTKRSNKSISNWRNRGNRLRKSDPVLRKMR